MKFLAIAGFLVVAGGLGWKWIQGPEAYLKKKTKRLIALASHKGPAKEMSLISKISKMSKLIHVKVSLKAEYKGQIYTAHSLNEFRSLLMAYFKQGPAGRLGYKGLTVKLGEDKKTAEAGFQAFFERGAKSVSCRALLKWIKEKKWHVKQIDVFGCAPSGAGF